MYREQYGEYAYWCLGEEEEEDLYLFRVSHSDALSTAINRGLDKNLNGMNFAIVLKYYFYR